MLDIEIIKKRLLNKYPLFGGIIANLKYIENRDCVDYNGNPTLGTNGKLIEYHPDFIGSLTEEEQVFLFAHEVCHIAFDHIRRSKDKDPETWNIATDAIINAFLQQDGLPLVDGGVDIPGAINYSADELYDNLLREKKEKGFNSNSNNNVSNDDAMTTDGMSVNRDVGHDTHSMWAKALEDEKKECEQESNSSNENNSQVSRFLKKIFSKNRGSNNSQDEDTSKEQQEIIDNYVKQLSRLSESKVFKNNKLERKKQYEELLNTLVCESIRAGSTTDSSLRKLDNIGISKPLVDWRQLLKESIKVELDWSYKNASIEDGVVTPHLEEFPKPETEILLDTSGSIDETLLKNFLRECKNILATSKVKVGCFDTKFYGFYEIRNVEDIDNIPFHGGGGTDFDIAINSFSRRVENKIIFTDGRADMPSKYMNAIWIVFGDTSIKPLGGRVIPISDSQLRNLYFMANYQVETKYKTR